MGAYCCLCHSLPYAVESKSITTTTPYNVLVRRVTFGGRRRGGPAAAAAARIHKTTLTAAEEEEEEDVAESTASPAPVPEQPGGKMMAELVGAFNQLTHRIKLLSTSSSRLLFKTLKLAIPILQALPLAPPPPPHHAPRSPLSKALSVAVILADLQVPPLDSQLLFVIYTDSKHYNCNFD